MNRNTVQNAQARHGPSERCLWPVVAPMGMSRFRCPGGGAVIVLILMGSARLPVRTGMIMGCPMVNRAFHLLFRGGRLVMHRFGRMLGRWMCLCRWSPNGEDKKKTGDKPQYV
jgi:hypothetical protein